MVFSTMTAGMLLVSSEPILDGGPITLFATTTAIAPAFAACVTLTRNVQIPRWISAILPVK